MIYDSKDVIVDTLYLMLKKRPHLPSGITRSGLRLALQLQKAIEIRSADLPDVALVCSRLSKINKTLTAFNELRCSEELSDRQQETMAKKSIRLAALTSRYAKDLGLLLKVNVGVLFNDDPRGPAIKLTLPEQYRSAYDCFGGEGVCVP